MNHVLLPLSQHNHVLHGHNQHRIGQHAHDWHSLHQHGHSCNSLQLGDEHHLTSFPMELSSSILIFKRYFG